MIFMDANVLVYAFLAPKRTLSKHEVQLKENAKGIVRRIEGGEEVATSLIHLSEVANVLEAGMPLPRLTELLRSILGMDNILIVESTKNDYLLALDIAVEEKVGPNDALALVLMSHLGISQIYSFDKHLEGVDGIKRVAE